VPLAAVTFVGVLLAAPRDADREPTPLRRTLAESDIPGILLFIAMLTSLLVFLLDLPHGALWWLLPVFAVAAGLFVWRELRAAHPFIDLRMLAGNRTLLLVYLCFAIFNVVYYSAFFGLPQYLQEGAGYDASAAGLLMFPLAAVTIVVTPLAARAIERFGLRPTLLTGAVTLVIGAALLALAAADTAPWVLLVITAALGIPYCVVSIAMNQSLYAAARPQDAGVAAGIFQTSRYLGAIVATTILGLMFSTGQTPGNWLVVVGVATALAVVHLGILVMVRPRERAGA
jgi:predicted MFS family arabinose efflux permease